MTQPSNTDPTTPPARAAQSTPDYKKTPPKITDGVFYRCPDGLVEVVYKVKTARRSPQHGTPIVCLLLHPRPLTRIQKVHETSDSLDVLFDFEDIKQLLTAIATADPNFHFTLSKTAKIKSPERKRKWYWRNEAKYGWRRKLGRKYQR